jgi:hypothetical protein
VVDATATEVAMLRAELAAERKLRRRMELLRRVHRARRVDGLRRR